VRIMCVSLASVSMNCWCLLEPSSALKVIVWVTRVNSTNVLDEGLRIGGIGRRMNSKVKISKTRHVSRINMVVNLAYSQSVPDRPLLAPIYRWPGLKEPVGSDTYYNVYIQHGLVLRLQLVLGLA
jgi:hypothetical protein